MTEAVFDGLPSEDKVLDSVALKVREGFTEHSRFLAPLAKGLLGLPVVQTFVRDWWKFLVKIMVDNADRPPTPARALRFTRARREARQEELQRFIRHDDVRAQASTLPEGRVNRDLTAVFLTIECVSEATSVSFFFVPGVQSEDAFSDVGVAFPVQARGLVECIPEDLKNGHAKY